MSEINPNPISALQSLCDYLKTQGSASVQIDGTTHTVKYTSPLRTTELPFSYAGSFSIVFDNADKSYRTTGMLFGETPFEVGHPKQFFNAVRQRTIIEVSTLDDFLVQLQKLVERYAGDLPHMAYRMKHTLSGYGTLDMLDDDTYLWKQTNDNRFSCWIGRTSAQFGYKYTIGFIDDPRLRNFELSVSGIQLIRQASVAYGEQVKDFCETASALI